MKSKIKSEVSNYLLLMRNVPVLVMVLFVTSVILMNLLANKEIGRNGILAIFLVYGYAYKEIRN